MAAPEKEDVQERVKCFSNDSLEILLRSVGGELSKILPSEILEALSKLQNRFYLKLRPLAAKTSTLVLLVHLVNFLGGSSSDPLC